ncbi:MAG: ABC transporter transmembrane domain-containing protein, partial [Spirochaetaceae bacterium]|nr:ABC transporter transmembrane domain-containing protein [Spirochaetaceae bacterium]
MSDLFRDDEIVGKAFDLRLTRRMLRFLRPYRAIFALCVVLTMGLAGIELALPYFSKTAIDAYMRLPYAVVTLPEAPRAGEPISLGGGRYVVRTSAVDPETLGAWETADAIENERALFISDADDRASTAARVSAVFARVPGGYLASETALETLSPRDTETLRGGALASVLRLALFFALALVVRFLFGVVQVYLLEYTSQRVMYDMRREIFAHILRLPVAVFDRAP